MNDPVVIVSLGHPFGYARSGEEPSPPQGNDKTMEVVNHAFAVAVWRLKRAR